MIMRICSLYLLIIFTGSTNLFCQDVITRYFSKDRQEVSQEQSFFYEKRRALLENGDTIYTFYSSSGKKRSISVVNSRGEENGFFSNYYENGNLKSKGMMKSEFPVGTIISYYPNGKAQAIESFAYTNSVLMNYYDSAGRQIIKDGTGDCVCYFGSYSWSSFLEKGKLVSGKKDSVWTGDGFLRGYRYKENYAEGILISGESYDSAGQTYPYKLMSDPPRYKSGQEGLYKIVSKNLKYPAEARKAKVEGLVGVTFIVERDGSLTNFEIVDGKYIGKGCDEEAIRVVKLFKDWEPGRLRGVPVRVRFVYPIRFKLD